MDEPRVHETERDTLAERLFGAVVGFFDVYSVYLGVRLGLYSALAVGAPVTSKEVADRAGVAERYAREWLEHQAVTGILGTAGDGDARTFSLPAGHAEVLLDPTSLSYLAPFARLAMSTVRPVDQVLEAFRTGGGVSWTAYGPDASEGQSDQNRPVFTQLLGSEWLPAIAEVHERLTAGGRVAEVGCGGGWAAIAMANAYPRVEVHGFDLDEASIDLARVNAAAEGLDDRVRFEVRDCADPSLAGAYDLVTAFECIHDMSRPVEVLAAMRNMAAEGGTVLIVDERVADTFVAPGDELERMFYGFSITCCLPTGMDAERSAGTGTVMRASTLAAYAEEAGYSAFEVAPVEHDFFRLYRLTP